MKIRTLNKNELILLFSYIELEGWDVEKLHISALYKTNPNDFFIALKDKKIVGFILAIKHNPDFGLISTFLVVKEFRSLGFGKAIFKHALQHLDGFQIALDSITGYEKFYEKFGFKKYFNVYTYKYITDTSKIKTSTIKTDDFNEKLSLIDKNKYQKFILKNQNVQYKEIKQKNQISSFAYAFQYIDGYKITLEAKNIDEAVSLFLALTKELTNGTNIYLEASVLSELLLNVTEALNMSIHSKFSRMYNKIIK